MPDLNITKELISLKVSLAPAGNIDVEITKNDESIFVFVRSIFLTKKFEVSLAETKALFEELARWVNNE